MTARSYASPGWLAAYLAGAAAWAGLALIGGARAVLVLACAGVWLLLATASAVTRGGR